MKELHMYAMGYGLSLLAPLITCAGGIRVRLLRQAVENATRLNFLLLGSAVVLDEGDEGMTDTQLDKDTTIEMNP